MPLRFETKNSFATLVFVFAAFLFAPNSINAQIKLEIDDEVKVPFLNDWHDGVVIDKKANKYLVRFNWNGSSKEEVFTRKQIRALYEYEGLDFGRSWESSSGTFKVVASLLRIEGEEVVLIKPDFSELTVQLKKLSTRDNGYVKKFKKQFEAAVRRGELPDAVPELPEIETIDGSFGQMSSFGESTSENMDPLGAMPNYLRTFKQRGVGSIRFEIFKSWLP